MFICPDPGYGTKGWKFAYVLVVVVVLFSGYDASCILNIFCIFLFQLFRCICIKDKWNSITNNKAFWNLLMLVQ